MKKIYFLLLSFSFLFCLKSNAQQGNYLLNGNFENDYKNWIFGANNGSAIDFTIESANPISGTKSAKLTVNAKGANPWDAFLNMPLTLHKGVPMKLTFKVKASSTTFMNVEVAQNYPPFLAPVRTTQNVPLTTEVQTLEYTFTPDFSDANMKVSLMFGNLDPGVTIWVDDVIVQQTSGTWDGNIIPNGDFNEFSTPSAADNFPAYRKKKLSHSSNTIADGGWEGGFAFDAPNDIVFDIDQTGKLNGPNSAHIRVNNKVAPDFFNGSYAVFFQASDGGVYNFSADVVASKDLTFRVAMNTHPFDGPDKFSFDINATTTKQTISFNNITLVKPGFHQIFFAGYPTGGPYDIYIDNVKLVRVDAAPLGIAKEATYGKFGVYPNPSANGQISLDLANLPAFKQATVYVLDTRGAQVFQKEISANDTGSLDTGLNSGLYIIKVLADQRVFTQKLIIN